MIAAASAALVSSRMVLLSEYDYDQPLVGKPISELTTVEYNTILFGVVWGFLGKEGLTEVETCVKDASMEASGVFVAFKDMLSGQTVEAVMTLLSVVENLHALSTDCHSMQDDIATLEAWALNLYQ